MTRSTRDMICWICAIPLGLALMGRVAVAQSPSPSATQQSLSPLPVYTGVTIRRPTLMVRNMDRALALYRDILGLRVGRLNQDAPESYVFTIFNIPVGTIVHHATLDTDKAERVLSLIEVKTMPPQRGRAGLRTSAILVNANGRLAEIRKRLITGGYKVLPNHSLAPNGTEFGLIDADGHLIALYEFPAP